MSINSHCISLERKKLLSTLCKRSTVQCRKEKNFLTIGPAFPSQIKKKIKKFYNTYDIKNKHDKIPPIETFTLQFRSNEIHISRSDKEKEKYPDRLNLDRRGLTVIPILENENKLRLLSLQHNLINSFDGLKDQMFPYLVFLDVYDNQLEQISWVQNLENLRVLLLGKNRLKMIQGFQQLKKLEVLDLHGNQIQTISGLEALKELKVLNLAGNQLRVIEMGDLQGLCSLQELNLRRNRLKKLMGFCDIPSLQKLFLSNNEIQSVEDMSNIIKAASIKELSIDNNPVFLGGDCVSFLVSYLPNLSCLNSMQVTDMVRKAAMSWRKSKELTNSIFMDLSSDISMNGRRQEVISNARTNWELIRSQTKCLTVTLNSTISKVKKLEPDVDFILTSISKSEKTSQPKQIIGNTRVHVLGTKKQCSRTPSQDSDNSQNTPSSNSSKVELYRLPPVLVPIISKMERRSENISFKDDKLSDSLSSIGPNIDSSLSSLNSTYTNSSNDLESSNEEFESDDEDGSPAPNIVTETKNDHNQEQF